MEHSKLWIAKVVALLLFTTASLLLLINRIRRLIVKGEER